MMVLVAVGVGTGHGAKGRFGAVRRHHHHGGSRARWQEHRSETLGLDPHVAVAADLPQLHAVDGQVEVGVAAAGQGLGGEQGIHLPRQYRSHQGQFVKDLYRAAAAHAAAHQAYSLTTFERKKLKPLQLAIIGLLEDARVELLAIKAMPGLRKLWLGFFDARRIQDTGSEGIGVDSLLLRLAHVLLDPSREDDNPWVMKGRRLFAEFQQQGGDMEKICENGLNKECGLLINSARQIIYAGHGEDFADAARANALAVQSQMSKYLNALPA